MQIVVRPWYKSSDSTAANNCVETQFYVDGSVDVRNSKDPQGAAVRFTAGEWAAFISGAKRGEFETV